MKIKNILALGLVAVVSGISTAQTYTATAGTNGVTDIQSDYSVATGDGASVSVDVPLEFELPKKVAIAVHDGTSFTTNALFDGLAWDGSDEFTNPSTLKVTWDGQFANSSYTSTLLEIIGAVYTNTDNTQFSIPNQSHVIFTHETDPNSTVNMNPATNGACRMQLDSGIRPTSNAVINFGASELINTDNVARFRCYHYMYKSSVNATDRAGKYFATQTFTITVL